MKLALISDTHALHRAFPSLPTADVIIHAGDFCHFGGEHGLQDFLLWYSELPYRHKLLIGGNHDFLPAEDPMLFRRLLPDNIHYLEDGGVEIEGVHFWGSPVQPDLVGMAFGKYRGESMNEHWDLIPESTDILITHTPPFGILDRSRAGRNLGCESLQQQLARIQPRLHVFGHIHASFGETTVEQTHFINATSIQNGSNLLRPPFTFEL